MQTTFADQVGLAWLVKVRILILTVLLGIELAIAQFTPLAFSLRLFVETILLAFAVSGFYLLLLRVWKKPKPQAVMQVVSDLVLVSLLVYVTGGVDSSLNFLFPLVLIVASIVLPRAWAYLTAALAFILYGAVLELCYFEIVPSYATTHPGVRTLQGIIFVNLFGYLAVAYLAGLLADKLRQADKSLEFTRGALEDLQALHENIIQSASNGLITTGLDGRISLVNASAEKLIDRSEKNLLGEPIGSLFQDDLPHCSSQQMHAEVRYVAPNGFRKTFRIVVSELTVPGRGAVGLVYTLDDLTQIRRLEREVRMQDRLAAVGRLSAAIAHEVRNPLTSIAGSASLLAEMPDLNDEHRRLLQIVTRESERLNDIITDFLAYSRNKQYRFANVNLIPLLEDTLTLLGHRLQVQNTGITIERRYLARPVFVTADGDRLKQVFWNFCENAVRAMKNGGTLTIAIEECGADWQIGFADTGPGMSPQMVEKVFEPFQSQFEGGTGLGLAIVYQIVQAHEGQVFVRSTLGQGCTFILRLRKAAEEGALPASPSNQQASERLSERARMPNILICDDERSICEMLDISLRREGYKVETVNSGEAGKKKLESALFDVVITDIKMPNINGIEVLRHAHKLSPESAVILITAVDDFDAAVDAVKAGGATDYIRKSPGLVDEVKIAVRRALERVALSRQNFALKRDAANRNSLDNIIGASPAMEKLKHTIRTVASTQSTVLIYGESGTGKELVARAVHTCSPRATEPFVSINCGAFPETLLESELFGYVKGAFTGANQNKRGLFEVADGGTIFLDEIGEMSLTMQVKLLRVLQERCVRPVGGTDEIAIDVRVIAATNRDLEQQVTESTFREDLYYRLNVIPITVPPLRQRREDLPLLVNHFLRKYVPAARKSIVRVSPDSLAALANYEWPGNVRQLENTIERAVALETADELRVELPVERAKARAAAAGVGADGLPAASAAVLPEGMDMENYVADIERTLLKSALAQSNGVQARAADVLKISYRSFRHLMKKYKL